MKRISYFSKLSWIFLVFAMTIAARAETLSGRVYEGEYLSEPPAAQGLSGVSVKLYGSHSSGALGDEVSSDTSGSDGWYSLETEQGYEYFTIECEGKSGYSFEGSSSVGGSASGEQIQYSLPLTGKTLTGNKFWYTSNTPEPPSNNPPIAQDDSATTSQNTAVDIDVLHNDNDPDGDPLHINSVTDPPHGTTVNNGSNITYTPDPGFTGTDTFDYIAGDGNGGTDTATVTVTVEQGEEPLQNNPPVANAGGPYSTQVGNPVMLDGSGSYDPDTGDSITGYQWYWFSQGNYIPINGVLTTPTIWWVPPVAGQFTLKLEVTDSHGEIDTDTSTIDVQEEEPPDGMGTLDGYKRDADTGEGLENWRIFIDLNGNSEFDAGETSDLTDSNGYYRINEVEPGTYLVCEQMQDGWEPANGASCVEGVTIVAGVTTTQDFHNRRTEGPVPRTGTIRGTKFNDLNGNGQRDPGEPGLPGWQIRLFVWDEGYGWNGIPGAMWTGANGDYEFTGQPPGDYRLDEVQQSGWRQTYPEVDGQPGVWLLSLEANEVVDKINFGNHQTGTEPPEGTGTIRIIKSAPPDPPVSFDFTGDLGPFILKSGESKVFSELPPGQYTVTESLPGGDWKMGNYQITGDFDGGTTSNPTTQSITIDLDAGEDIILIIYNYIEEGPEPGTGSIHGVKFNDLNENGRKDDGEPCISGWEIVLTDSNGVVLTTTTTNRNGEYQFENLEPGIYGLSEEDKQDWVQTFPAEKHYSGVRLSQGEVLMDMDFGNHQTGTEPPEGTATILGVKFNDINGNNIKDPGEPGLLGWHISLFIRDDNSGWNLFKDTTTGAQGGYVFTDLSPGDYRVEENQQSGWTRTYPTGNGYHTITLQANQTIEDLDFGNYRTGTEPPEGTYYTSDVCFNVEITTPTGTIEKLTLTGPMTQRVYVGPNGSASDKGGNGLDDVITELVSLNLWGVSPSLGPITISLNTNTTSTGQIEERANNTAGILDIPPFTATGDADSFFDVFFQLQIGGTVLLTNQPIRLTSIITHIPPVEDYSDISQSKVELLDQNGQSTGFYFGPITSCEQAPPDGNGGGSVVVIKEATPADDTLFDFAIHQPGGFFDLLVISLRDPSGNTWSIGDLDHLQKVVELVPVGWTLRDITITGDTDDGSTIDLANATVDVDFDEGENIVITFKNEKTGEIQYDYGDAPDPTYPTLLVNNGARHRIDPSMYLGSSIDPEMDGQPNSTADGDNTGGTNDEDGVTMPSIIIAGQSISINVVASSAGVLNAWIDFNINGDWADPGEHFIAAQPVVPGTNTFSLMVPASAQPGQSFARFRFSSERDISFDGEAPDGEVEDYAVAIQEPGRGSLTIIKDATPKDDTPFWITVTYGIMGGAAPYRDPSSNTSTLANGPTGTYNIGETVTSGWILKDIVVTGDTDNGTTVDLNQGSVNVDLDEGENIVITFKNEKTGEAQYDFGDAPDSYKTYHNSGGPYHDIGEVMLGSSVDAETDGQPGPLADADSDDGISFPLGLVVGQPATVIILVNAPIGVPAAITGWIDYDHNGTFDDNTERAISGTYTGAGSIVAWTETFLVPQTATAGDTYARFRIYRTESGVDVLPSPTGYGEEGEVEDYRIEIKPEGMLPSGNIIGGIKFNDINGNGLWEGGEPTMQNWTFWLDTNNDGTPDLFTKTTSAGNLGGSFDFTGLGPGTYTVGEEQQPGWTQTCPIGSDTVTITFPDDGNQRASVWFFGNHGLDFGDAPGSYGSASHDVGGYRLGQLVDAENVPLFSPNADGDDLDNVNDEDGVTLLSDLVIGQTAAVKVQTTYGSGGLGGPLQSGSIDDCHPAIWIDFDRDGSFQDPAERIPASADSYVAMPQGIIVTRPFQVPATAVPGTTFMRVRAYRGWLPMGACPLSPTGHYGEGEVEDYEVEIKLEGNVLPPGEIISGTKFNDLNGNKQQDMGEPGLANWVIWIDINGNGAKDSGEETLTNSDGSFYFFGLPDGIYTVHEEIQSGWTQTYPGGDGTYTITVQDNQQIPSIVFGNRQERDYGDAPANYPSASNELGGPWLGSIPPDAESGMQPNPPGFGDDNNGIDDEDGVTFLWDLVPGQYISVTFFDMDPSGQYRVMGGWIDFNRDGYWDNQTEFMGQTGGGGGAVGHSLLSINIPAGTIPGKTYARFRVCRDPNNSFAHINPDGDLGPGEVEDYEVEIVADGNTPPPGGMVQGYKFNDLNGNRMWDPNEPALAGWTIWLDANQNGIVDANDLYTQTGMTGSFLFTGLAAGHYLLGEVQQAGWTQTAPAGGTYTVTADPNLPYMGLLFGNQRTGTGPLFDWGDAPDPSYPTLRLNNGANHMIVPGIFLGGGVDTEPDGLPAPDARGDDYDGSDDEDGVIFITPIMPGQQAELEVAASSAGYLDAWIDFDAEGSWSQASDQIFTSEPILTGSNILYFQVPASIAIDIDTYARFRFSTIGGLAPDGAAQDGEVEDYHILLGENGPGVPGEEELPHIKWSQPPIEIDPNTDAPPVFCGWNEPARSIEQSGSKRQWRMDADDFRCLGPIPITRIRWWGGYKDWTQPEPPVSQPETWHIDFWANQLEGIVQNELFPERIVWSLDIPVERVHFEPVGLEEFPVKNPEMCYFYELKLEPEEWFHQTEFESNYDIFWISITAVYPADIEQVNMWGWMTRPHIWGHGAVMPAIMGDWPTFDERLFPGRIYPIENSLLCGQNQAYDLCFELLTEQPWVKWDQPFTGIREWQDYSDDKSMALEQDDGAISMLRQVADDWFCERQNPVTAIVWNGSYIGYGYEACKCNDIPEPRRPDYFLLSFRTNATGANAESDNYPGEKIWEFRAENYDEVLVGYDRNPDDEPNEPVFRYSVMLPEDAWFRQESPETIYWFSVVAVYRESVGEIPYDWGWTNHSRTFGGPAMSLNSDTAAISQWQSVFDSTASPVDMSFILFTKPE